MIWSAACKWKRDEEWVVILGLAGYHPNGFFLWLLLISNTSWIDLFLTIYLIWNQSVMSCDVKSLLLKMMHDIISACSIIQDIKEFVKKCKLDHCKNYGHTIDFWFIMNIFVWVVVSTYFFLQVSILVSLDFALLNIQFCFCICSFQITNIVSSNSVIIFCVHDRFWLWKCMLW